MGIGCKNVVPPRELNEQPATLRKGAWLVAGRGRLFVERFVDGPSSPPSSCAMRALRPRDRYPAVERVFNRNLPPTERFSLRSVVGVLRREAPGAGEISGSTRRPPSCASASTT
jgi:hypothetical protein